MRRGAKISFYRWVPKADRDGMISYHDADHTELYSAALHADLSHYIFVNLTENSPSTKVTIGAIRNQIISRHSWDLANKFFLFKNELWKSIM